jgi:hypothetical protein
MSLVDEGIYRSSLFVTIKEMPVLRRCKGLSLLPESVVIKQDTRRNPDPTYL